MRHLSLSLLALLGCANTVSPGPAALDAAAALDARPPVDAAARDDRASPADVTPPSPDGGRVLTDDCAPGTWCWERPLPSGERIVGARVLAGREVVFATVGGTLARWDGTRWRTVILSLPGEVRSVWAQRSDEVYLLCAAENAPGAMARAWLVRVRGDSPEVLSGPRMGDAYQLEGTGPNDLWTLGSRGMIHWDGAAWRTVDGPGDVLLSGLYVRGANDLVVLENWGSGSGTGRLHRFDGTSWTLLTSFEGARVRVEAPLVPLDGSLYLRAWDSRASQPEVVRYDLAGGQVELITPPTDNGSVDLHTDGRAIWASYANRVWRREGAQWRAMPAFTVGYGGRIVGVGADTWALGATVARLREGGWEGFSSPLAGAAGFWRDRSDVPALVTLRPCGLAAQDPAARGDWPVRALLNDAPAEAWTPDGDDGGWFATNTDATHVVARSRAAIAPWPAGSRRQGEMGAWGENLWMVSTRGIERWRAGAWADPVAVPRIPVAPGQTPAVRALHGVGPAAALFSTELVTGDKQVHVDVFALRGAEVSPVASLRGVFGNSTDVVIAGRLPAVWVSFGGLRRWDGNDVRLLEPDVTPRDLHVLADGRAVGTDGERVYVWTADGRRVGALPIPRMRDLHFSRVMGDMRGVIRVAAGDAVLRFTP
ncbi:MAG: hypothetical protein U0325_13215 [Polyangiales bacterium]